MRPTEGFTIIEVLIAVTLLSIIVLVVMASLTGSFRLSGNTTLQSVATNRAQATIEAVRGQWQSLTPYDAACMVYTLPTGTTISVQNETASGVVSGSAYTPTYATSCTSASATTFAPMRRVTVTSTNTSGANSGQSVLTLEIARPAQ